MIFKEVSFPEKLLKPLDWQKSQQSNIHTVDSLYYAWIKASALMLGIFSFSLGPFTAHSILSPERLTYEHIRGLLFWPHLHSASGVLQQETEGGEQGWGIHSSPSVPWVAAGGTVYWGPRSFQVPAGALLEAEVARCSTTLKSQVLYPTFSSFSKS